MPGSQLPGLRQESGGKVTARWKAVAAIDPDVLAKAAQLECAFTDPDWAEADAVQCQLGDIPHVFHAAFLRDGAQREPCSDVFLRWHQDMPGQWAQDLAVCLSKRTPLGDVCTIFRDHPGPCEWQQTDPLDPALSAYADQLIQDWRQGGSSGSLTKWLARLGDPDAA
ncbi:hypothetical protein ACFXAZ_07355 [Streptomyces sp. NPDC059477]|uniref:hypothetical protein n=1 Tax=Streptomyces sp. NPDC059477 TaxID=3346847 RepID=UPI0036ADD744